MPTGAGFQPAGSSSAGFGAPTQSSEGPNAILPDSFGGGSYGSRKINPVAGDYVINSDGRLQGMNNLQQLVQLAISNAAPELQRIDKLDRGFARAVESILTSALAVLVNQNLIEILGVSVRMGVSGGLKPGQAVTVLRWRDRTTQEERSESI